MKDIDMKETMLYYKLLFTEKNYNEFVKEYDDFKIYIDVNKQVIHFGEVKIHFKGLDDLAALECFDRLINSGVKYSNLKIKKINNSIEIAIFINGKQFLVMFPHDYDSKKRIEAARDYCNYYSCLRDGLIINKYIINYNGKQYNDGLFEDKFLSSISNKFSNNKYVFKDYEDDNFIIKNDILISYKKYFSQQKKVTIPMGVKHIAQSLFWDNKNIEEVILPDSLITIGGDAFYYCTNLKAINLPISLERIGNNPFTGCHQLVISNHSKAFKFVNNVIYDKDMEIAIHCNLWAKIDNLVLPETIKTIGKHAFHKCNGIKQITLPRSLINIENNPFSECTNLKLINLSMNIVIEDGIIYNKSKTKILACLKNELLDLYRFTSTERLIGKNVFYNCDRLTRIIIGSNIIKIPYNPFSNCKNLTLENYSENYKLYKGALYNKDLTILHSVTNAMLKNNTIILSPNLKVIGRNAFCGCNELESLILPQNIIGIGRGAFSKCTGLKELVIPKSIQYFEDWVFCYCENMISIKIPKNIEIPAKVFNGTKVKMEYY